MGKNTTRILLTLAILCGISALQAQVPAVPPRTELDSPFGKADTKKFLTPPKVYHPETWFHYIGGNVSKEGITADLEAIAAAGITGIQLFHGQFGGPWPGVEPQIACLSESWDDAVHHTAKECQRLGLRFTMLVCPGWALAGGPWIEPANAMRHLTWSRTDITGGKPVVWKLPRPQPSEEEWRDYRDVAVLAFPTPQDDTGSPLMPASVRSNRNDLPWKELITGTPGAVVHLAPAREGQPNWVEVTFPEATKLRTIEFSSINGFNTIMCYEPGISVNIEAVMPDGSTRKIRSLQIPQSNWQDESPISLACSDIDGVNTYRISINNRHTMGIGRLRLSSAAVKDNWEAEAGWTLRSLIRGQHPEQAKEAFIDPARIIDLSDAMDTKGNLSWNAPEGNWTILRIGHVNTGMKNGPAPAEGTGWECDKFSSEGADAQFAGYIGRLIGPNGPLYGGMLDGMLMDSWECKTQTWTANMEQEFEQLAGYPLRQWLPAIFGYVVKDHETTTRFLRDWRATISSLATEKFFGGMAHNAHANGLTLAFETAFGDILPGDILEYYKYADVPMCEFWRHPSDTFVGSINFKPIKPTASAARLYGKPRVAAESFTSFQLTWDEHLSRMREVANQNAIEGVTHNVLHTYTHNPRTDFLPPGTSFGSNIGTPFLRGQTWWKHMPEFTTYLARCSYLLERGKPVSDVLWYLGDEFDHKPDQRFPFPEGFKYDYCNHDILLNRLSVRDGMIVTPEGITYRLLWLPDIPRLMPETLEKLYDLVRQGAVIVGNAPTGLATLNESGNAQKRFDKAVKNIWGKASPGIRKVGKGTVISGTPLSEALETLGLQPDVTGMGARWLHRHIEGADWYYICAPTGTGFSGTLDFRNTGQAEIWDPVTGSVTPAVAIHNGERTEVTLRLPQAGSCFVVFRKDFDITVPSATACKPTQSLLLNTPWTINFPEGWGIPETLVVNELKPWKELAANDEGKAFSGTATYTTTFDIGTKQAGCKYHLDLGRVDMIAAVSVNGRKLRTLWTAPYELDITEAVNEGCNELKVEVTGTWYNRLVYDAGQSEERRLTWTISGPPANATLQETGLMGPVMLSICE